MQGQIRKKQKNGRKIWKKRKNAKKYYRRDVFLKYSWIEAPENTCLNGKYEFKQNFFILCIDILNFFDMCFVTKKRLRVCGSIILAQICNYNGLFWTILLAIWRYMQCSGLGRQDTFGLFCHFENSLINFPLYQEISRAKGSLST